MYDDILKLAKIAMEKAIESLKRELVKVRTGRASISLVDDVFVDYYGTPTPLNQVATLAAPEPRLITVQPWEKNLLPEIEKAILKADLGLNPSSDGVLIRLPIPALTEDRRKEMAKLGKRFGEDSKIVIRNARREANEAIKKLEKDKEISADDLKRGEKDVQVLTDDFINQIDDIVATKEKEVMEI
jgi:ribosome recycling factor